MDEFNCSNRYRVTTDKNEFTWLNKWNVITDENGFIWLINTHTKFEQIRMNLHRLFAANHAIKPFGINLEQVTFS